MRKLDLPRTSERIRGFTIPENDVLYLFDYDEVFKLTLGVSPSAEILDDDPYEFADSHPDFLGVSERQPILQAGRFKLAYTFDPTAPSQEIVMETPGTLETITFQTFSGDWFVATLTPCAGFLIIAEPYLIEIYSLK